jgi:hypothetical protein
MNQPPNLFYKTTRIPGLNIDLGPPPQPTTTTTVVASAASAPTRHLQQSRVFLNIKSESRIVKEKTNCRRPTSRIALNSAACILSLDPWDKSVAVLFVFCLVVLLRALAGFGHTETSCGKCALAVPDTVPTGFTESDEWMTSGSIGYDDSNGDEETLVDWQELDLVDGDDTDWQQFDDFPYKKPESEVPKHDLPASHHPSQGEDNLHPQTDKSELSFFLKHFNDRYDFTPLDAVDEIYEDEQEQWSLH